MFVQSYDRLSAVSYATWVQTASTNRVIHEPIFFHPDYMSPFSYGYVHYHKLDYIILFPLKMSYVYANKNAHIYLHVHMYFCNQWRTRVNMTPHKCSHMATWIYITKHIYTHSRESSASSKVTPYIVGHDWLHKISYVFRRYHLSTIWQGRDRCTSLVM